MKVRKTSAALFILMAVLSLLLLATTPALALPDDEASMPPAEAMSGRAPTIGITAVEGTGAALDPEEAYYNPGQPADVLTTIIWNDASAVDSIVDSAGGALAEDVHYTIGFLNGTAALAVHDAYLSGRLLEADDEVRLTVNFDMYAPAIFTITAISEEVVPRYTLAISSTAGGAVIEPGEGVFTYAAGTVVELVATADDGYRFSGWVGDVGSIAEIGAPSTSIAMEGSHNVTANFASGMQRSLGKSLLVAGLMAAAVAAGLLVFFLRRKRARRSEDR